MRGSFLLRRIFSSVSLRRRTESRFHIFILSATQQSFKMAKSRDRRLQYGRFLSAEHQPSHKNPLKSFCAPSRLFYRCYKINLAKAFLSLPEKLFV